MDERRLGVRRRDLGRGQCFGQRGQQLLRGWRAAELLRQHVERRDESAKLSARGAAPRDHSERRRRGAVGRRPLRDGGRRVRRREAREDRGVARFLRRLIVLLVVVAEKSRVGALGSFFFSGDEGASGLTSRLDVPDVA